MELHYMAFADGLNGVLFVDDEHICLDIGAKMLRRLGYIVLTAQDGMEAVEIYRMNREVVDLIILDFNMPLNGEKALRKLKEMDKDVKILIMSGWLEDYHLQELLYQGCNGYLQKPFNISMLSEKINAIFGN